MQAITAVKADIKSSPVAIIKKVNSTTVMKYTEIKAKIVSAVRSGMLRLLIFTVRTACGCKSSTTSRRLNLNSTSARTFLMPPPIEPELAKRLERKNIHSEAKSGQVAKSVLAKPLAKPIDTKLKPTKRNASERLV